MQGYLSREYATSLNEFGTVLPLKASGGWLLKRPIENTGYFDGMGIYPLLCCHDWSALPDDLASLNKDLVSVSMVSDPCGNYTKNELQNYFSDICIPFKTHFITDLKKNIKTIVSKHHLRNVKKACSNVSVNVEYEPEQVLSKWNTLYCHLIQRHNIQGIAKFSETVFNAQFKTPGLTIFSATYEEEIVGMVLFIKTADIVYYHLGAYNAVGYQTKASYAIFWNAIEYFQSNGYSLLNLGGAAGISDNKNDGLSRFKHGWSSHQRLAYFCGKIFDRKAYDALVKKSSGIINENYFPLYRSGSITARRK